MDQYDIVEQSRRTRLLRMGLLALFAVLSGRDLGWAITGGLLGLGLASEAASAVIEWVTRRARRRDPQRADGPIDLPTLAVLLRSAVWTTLGVAYWSVGREPQRLVAVLLLSTLLFNAIQLAFGSRRTAALYCVPPILALTGLLLGFSGFRGADLWPVAASLAAGFAYAGNLMRWTSRQTLALKAANVRLLEQEQALRAQTERAEAANAAKSRFLAIVSHELRTPMNGVLGMARALGQGKLSPDQVERVGMLVRSGDGLMTILNELLDLSKIEAGKLELETAPFDLHEVGRRVHDLWAQAAADKGLRFDLETDVEPGYWLAGDEVRLGQILTNLVSNAVKFTNDGEVRLTISHASQTASQAQLRFAVRDTGVGLSAEQAARLFQPFVQAERSTARHYGGTGLGLSISQQLAELMGSQIALDSAPGRGAEFSFTLTFDRCAQAVGPAETARDLGSLRVIVADDNPINLAVARSVLEAAGIEVLTASDGQGAIDAWRTGEVDALLLDIHMPGMDGVTALRTLRAMPGGATVPVIAFTADAMNGAEAELRALGFDGVEAKPIVPARLLQTLAAALGGNAAARAAPAQLSETG